MPLDASMRRTWLATLSTVLALAVAIPIVSTIVRGSDAGTVRLVDTADELGRLMGTKRPAATDSDPDATDPDGIVADAYPPPLILRELNEEEARSLFPSLATARYIAVEHAHYARLPHQTGIRQFKEHADDRFEIRTNDHGMREDEDVRTDAPAIRVIVTGDSHIAGVVPNCESAPNVLERLLSEVFPGGDVDVLNCGVGGYAPHNYLGVLERFAHLEPDVFVIVLYGGNDFHRTVQIQRFYERRGLWKREAIPRGERRERHDSLGRILGQEATQIRYFQLNPEDIDVAVDTVNAILWRARERCAELGVAFVVAYLPPAMATQPSSFKATIDDVKFALAVDDEAIAVGDTIANRVIEFLASRAVPVVDARPSFRTSTVPLYWHHDYHLNTTGHERLAKALLPVVQRAVEKRDRETPGVKRLRAMALTIPTQPGQEWSFDGQVRSLSLGERGALLFDRGEQEAVCRVRIGSNVRGLRRLQFQVMCDGDHELDIQVGIAAVCTITGSDTERALRLHEVEFELPLDPDSAPIELRIERVSAESPVVIQDLRFDG